MKTHTKWYQYVQSLQFSHNGMIIMVFEMCDTEGEHSINMNMLI
jgi:hypothetical protein